MVGGDIRQFKAQHPELGSCVYKHKAEGTSELDPGGRTSKSESTLIAADGTLVRQIANKRGSFSVELVLDDVSLQHIKDTSASTVTTTYTLTLADGKTHSFEGFPVDVEKLNLNNRTQTVNFEYSPIRLV